MKMSESPSKIAGVQLGEAALNFIRIGVPPIAAKFALITKEGETAGFIEMGEGWSDKALEAMRTFSMVLEEEAMQRLFDTQPAETPAKEGDGAEPTQF